MTGSSFVEALANQDTQLKNLGEKIAGGAAEFFIQPAKIDSVDDPENLSRVRVLFDENSTSAKSDWLPILNGSSGRISTQYLGSKCLVGAVSGNADNAVVLGLYNDLNSEYLLNSAPVVVPKLDKADLANSEDPGAQCDEDNEGRVYLFSDNMSQDLKICIRRNNRQTDPDADVWEWKNLTRGLVIEKSTNPDEISKSNVKGDRKPLKKCSEELEGELITFSEDRDLRQTLLVCRKDENKEWAWVPPSAVPTYFRTHWPKCTEKIHGQLGVIDDGNNSELSICVRFDGDMKWVKYGTRTVVKFADKPAPPPKSEIIAGVGPNRILNITQPSQLASAVSNPLAASGLTSTALNFAGTVAAGLGGTGYTDEINSFLSGDAGIDLAMATGSKILGEQGISIPQLTGALGDISNSGNLLASLGQDAEAILKGGSVDPAALLSAAGSEALTNGLKGLSNADVGQFTSLLVGGARAPIELGVQAGLDQLTGPAAEIVSQYVEGLDLANAPEMLSSILGGAVNGGLINSVTSIAEGLDFGGVNVGALTDQLLGGNFGPVAGIFQDFAGFDSLNFLSGGLPLSASSLLGAAGLGGPLNLAFPGAGLAIPAVTALLGGNNPLTSILGGGGAFGALGGLFGGGGGPSCPCETVCRKVDHGVDSDGNRLLDPAGNLTIKNSNVYGGNILNNNNTCLAKGLGLSFTGIGKELIPSNIFDFTSVIKSIPRVGEMASSFEQAIKGGAEDDDLKLEMQYTFEAIEKTFKMADNNMSIMELIQRLNLLGSSDFMNNLIADKDGGLLGKMSTDDIEQSLAIKDLYRMVKQLNSVKKGGDAVVAPTPALIATMANPASIPGYFKKSKARALINLIKNILEALSILGSLDPELAAPFQDLETINTESKVLKDSLSAKLSTSQPKEDTLNYSYKDFSLSNSSNIRSLSADQLNSGDFDTLLKQISNEQERARRGEGDCS